MPRLDCPSVSAETHRSGKGRGGLAESALKDTANNKLPVFTDKIWAAALKACELCCLRESLCSVLSIELQHYNCKLCK